MPTVPVVLLGLLIVFANRSMVTLTVNTDRLVDQNLDVAARLSPRSNGAGDDGAVRPPVPATPPPGGAAPGRLAMGDRDGLAGRGGDMSAEVGLVVGIGRVSLLAVLIGTVVALLALAFVDAVGWLNDVLLVSPRARILFEDAPWLVAAATVAVPGLGGLAVGCAIRWLTPERRPLGPVDSVIAAQTGRPPGSVRGGMVSSLAAVVSLGAGASVGQYGPMVYLGTLIGHLVRRVAGSLPNASAVCIACGVAAAISTAFNAPIAGLVFAHEVVLRHYALQAFAPTTVAAATGYVIAAVVFDREPLFIVPFDGVEHGHEFVLFALEGALAALVAVAFMRLLRATGRAANASPIPPALRPALAGLGLGAVALALPEILGKGTEVLRFATIPDAFTLVELAVLVVAKTAMTALCLGFGFAGGVFSPSILIGVLFGALFGGVVADWTPIPHSGIVPYAISGMMAVASAVMGAPLTTIVMVLELTQNYHLTIAAMLAVVFANLVGNRLFGRSLADVQLSEKGFDFSIGRDEAVLANTRLVDFVVDDAPRGAPDEPIATVVARLARAGRAEAILVDDHGRYVGTLSLADALGHNQTAPAHTAARPSPIQFDETTSIAEAMDRLQTFIGEGVPVVSRTNGQLIGVAPENAVMRAYVAVTRRLRAEENAAL